MITFPSFLFSFHTASIGLNIDRSALNVFDPIISSIVIIVLKVLILIRHILQIIHFISALGSQVSEKISDTSVLLKQCLQLGDVLLVKLNLPFHVLKVG